MYAVSITCAVFLGIWLLYFKGDRLPFSDIIWKNGVPLVSIEGESLELVSVNGVEIDTLLKQAIAHWGPSYQHHFAHHFSGLLKEAGAWPGFCTHLVVKKEGKKKNTWQLNTTTRQNACLRKMRERQKITHWPQVPITQKQLARLDSVEDKTSGNWLEPAKALEDLYTLRWWLWHYYSYPERLLLTEERFCALKMILKKRISQRDFALQVQNLLAALNDIHTSVSMHRSGVRLPAKTLPFDLQEVKQEFICLKAGQKEFLASDYPLLISINGIAIQALFQTAKRLGGDPLNWMMRIKLILALHGQDSQGKLSVKLRSMDGREKDLVLNEILRQPPALVDFRVSGKKYDGSIGHLRLSRGLFLDPFYKKEIINEMYGLRDTKGLILDLRGNPGGSRHAIPLLMHYFIPPRHHPLILNIGAYKMAASVRPAKSAEVLRGRELYSDQWAGWTKPQQQVISTWKSSGLGTVLKGNASLSAPHFMITDTAMPVGAYYYAQPVVVLIDKGTASATELILANLKGGSNIKIMGEPSTGGSGYAQDFELPNSHLQLQLSSMRSYHANGVLVEHTQPDFFYLPTLEEMVEQQLLKKDGMIELAKAYLRK